MQETKGGFAPSNIKEKKGKETQYTYSTTDADQDYFIT